LVQQVIPYMESCASHDKWTLDDCLNGSRILKIVMVVWKDKIGNCICNIILDKVPIIIRCRNMWFEYSNTKPSCSVMCLYFALVRRQNI